MLLCYSAISSRSLRRDGADLKGFGISQQAFCNAKIADVYTSALLAAMVLVLRSSQPVSDTDAQAYTSSDSLPVLPTLAAVERVYSLDAEM